MITTIISIAVAALVGTRQQDRVGPFCFTASSWEGDVSQSTKPCPKKADWTLQTETTPLYLFSRTQNSNGFLEMPDNLK